MTESPLTAINDSVPLMSPDPGATRTRICQSVRSVKKLVSVPLNKASFPCCNLPFSRIPRIWPCTELSSVTRELPRESGFVVEYNFHPSPILACSAISGVSPAAGMALNSHRMARCAESPPCWAKACCSLSTKMEMTANSRLGGDSSREHHADLWKRMRMCLSADRHLDVHVGRRQAFVIR